jgi:hypothetical protein
MDLSQYSDEELKQIAAQPTVDNSISGQLARLPSQALDTTKRLVQGVSRGATGLLSLPAEVISLPYNLYQTATGGQPVTHTASTMKFFGQKPTQQGDVTGMFGEGMAGAVNIPSAVVGGLTNIAAKTAFPNSPVGQLGISAILPTVAATLAGRRASLPPGVPKGSTGETGITITPGQRSGVESQLVAEQNLRGAVQSRPAFNALESSQTAGLKDFAGQIQDTIGNPNLTATQIRDSVVGLATKASDAAVNKFRAVNRLNFNAATKAAGNTPIIATDNVVGKIDDLISRYDTREGAAFGGEVDALKQLRDSFVIKGSPATSIPSAIIDASGKPVSVATTAAIPDSMAKLTISELKDYLESFGKAARSGGTTTVGTSPNPLKGLSPGTAKYISREVLNGFRDDLNAAQLENLPGAAELVKAREGYKNGLKDLNAMAVEPLMKKLNIESEAALNPDAVVAGLLKAQPTQRKALLELVGNAHPEVYQTLRHRAWQEILAKVDTSTDMATQLMQLRKKVLTERIGNTADGIPFDDFLFSSVGEKAKFNSLVNDVNTISRKASSIEASQLNVQNLASNAASVIGGAPARYATNALIAVKRLLTGADTAKVAAVLTSPNAREAVNTLAKARSWDGRVAQDAIDKIIPFMTNYEKNLAKGGISAAGAAFVPPPVPQAPQQDLSSYSLEELQAIAKGQQP